MSIQHTPTATAAAAIPANRLVRFTGANTVNLNGAGQVPDGVHVGVGIAGVEGSDAPSGSIVAITDRKNPGRFKLVAAKAIAINTLVYAAASGKISDAAVGNAIGISRQAASGDNSQIEVDLFSQAAAPLVVFSGVATGASGNAVTIDLGVDYPRNRLLVIVRSSAGLSREPVTLTKSGTSITLQAGTLAATDEVTVQFLR